MFFILLENCIKLYNAFNVEEYTAAAIFIDAFGLVVELSKAIKIKIMDDL